jgi:hypothetical protein
MENQHDSAATPLGDGDELSLSPGGSPASKHVDQSPPFEWTTTEVAGQAVVLHDEPDRTATAYVVTGATRNVRVLAQQDAALYEGSVVTPEYDPDFRRVAFYHAIGGRIDAHPVEAWLDEPAICLREATGSVGFESLVDSDHPPTGVDTGTGGR